MDGAKQIGSELSHFMLSDEVTALCQAQKLMKTRSRSEFFV